MTRSFKHSKIIASTLCRSEKDDKKDWHGRMRARVRTMLNSGKDPDVLPKDVSNPWDMGKDGKGWWEGASGRLLRK